MNTNYEYSQNILDSSVEELKTHQRKNRYYRIIGLVRLIYISLLSTSIINSFIQTFHKNNEEKISFIGVLIAIMLAYSLLYSLLIFYNIKQLVEEVRLTENILNDKKFRLTSIILYCLHLIYILFTLGDLFKIDDIVFIILCCIYIICLVTILIIDVSLFRKSRILGKLN